MLSVVFGVLFAMFVACDVLYVERIAHGVRDVCYIRDVCDV